MELWCINTSTFRTNNYAESFHASLARRIIPCHPGFYVFLRNVIRIIKETKTELDVERLNPKIKRSSKDPAARKTTLLIENYIRGPPLALALDDFLREIFRVLHEKCIFEENFEEDMTQVGDDSSEVPMEIVCEEEST